MKYNEPTLRKIIWKIFALFLLSFFEVVDIRDSEHTKVIIFLPTMFLSQGEAQNILSMILKTPKWTDGQKEESGWTECRVWFFQIDFIRFCNWNVELESSALTLFHVYLH